MLKINISARGKEHYAVFYPEKEFNEDEFDTIGGLVVHEFGRLPKRNEHIKLGRFTFKVLNSDNRSVRLLQVTPQQQTLRTLEFG